MGPIKNAELQGAKHLIKVTRDNILLCNMLQAFSTLEMAGMLLHWPYLALAEHLVHLKHVHVADWYDNTPTGCKLDEQAEFGVPLRHTSRMPNTSLSPAHPHQ
jgi:hypothetical protein